MIDNEVVIEGVRTHLRQKGSREKKILMLHGWRGTSEVWVNNISQLSRKYDCVACDLPGFGQSADPDTAWGIEDYSGYIYKLTKNLGWNNFTLIGKSFGGQIAIKYAVNHHATLDGLVLVDAAGTEQKSKSTQIKIAIAKAGRSLITSIPFIDEERARSVYLSILGIKREISTLKEDIKRRVTNEDVNELLKKITTPTLVIWGEEDKVLPVEIGRDMASSIPNAKFITIPKAGHMAHVTHHEVFNRHVEDFLKTIE